jgi:hypothetical protein
MKLITCAADDCIETFEFDPQNPLKEYHSVQCQRRVRARRWRANHKNKPGGGDGGGGKRRQMALFSKQSVSAKRVKQPRPETAPLFGMSMSGQHEKHVGPVEVYPSPANPALYPDTCYRTFCFLRVQHRCYLLPDAVRPKCGR